METPSEFIDYLFFSNIVPGAIVKEGDLQEVSTSLRLCARPGGLLTRIAQTVIDEENANLVDVTSSVRPNGNGVHLLVPVDAVERLEGVTNEHGLSLLSLPNSTTLGRRTFDPAVTLFDVVSHMRDIEQYRLYGMNAANALEVVVELCTVTIDVKVGDSFQSARVTYRSTGRSIDVVTQINRALGEYLVDAKSLAWTPPWWGLRELSGITVVARSPGSMSSLVREGIVLAAGRSHSPHDIPNSSLSSSNKEGSTTKQEPVGMWPFHLYDSIPPSVLQSDPWNEKLSCISRHPKCGVFNQIDITNEEDVKGAFSELLQVAAAGVDSGSEWHVVREKAIGGLRPDLLVLKKLDEQMFVPVLTVECKSPGPRLESTADLTSEAVLNQATNYVRMIQSLYGVKWAVCIVTNLHSSYVVGIDDSEDGQASYQQDFWSAKTHDAANRLSRRVELDVGPVAGVVTPVATAQRSRLPAMDTTPSAAASPLQSPDVGTGDQPEVVARQDSPPSPSSMVVVELMDVVDGTEKRVEIASDSEEAARGAPPGTTWRSKTIWKGSGKGSESIVALLWTVLDKSAMLGRDSRAVVRLGRVPEDVPSRSVRTIRRVFDGVATVDDFSWWTSLKPARYMRKRVSTFGRNTCLYLIGAIREGNHGAVYLAAIQNKTVEHGVVASLFALKFAHSPYEANGTNEGGPEQACTQCHLELPGAPGEARSSATIPSPFEESARIWNDVYREYAHLKAKALTVVTGTRRCGKCNAFLSQVVLAMPYLHSPRDWRVVQNDAEEKWRSMVEKLLVKWENAGYVHTDVKMSNVGVWQDNDADPVLVLFDMETFAQQPCELERGQGFVLPNGKVERDFSRWMRKNTKAATAGKTDSQGGLEWPTEEALMDDWKEYARMRLGLADTAKGATAE